MAVTAFFNPTATSINSGVTTPDNGWTSNDAYAQWTSVAQWCRYNAFGITLPNGSEVTGVEVVVECKYTGAGLNRGLDIILALDGGGTESLTKSQTVPNTTDTELTYGGDGDLWGLDEITEAQIESSNFNIEVGLSSLSVTSIEVDCVKVRVYYDDSSIEQEGFRFRNDDGDEDGATWLANQDTDANQELDTITRLRALLNATGDPIPRGFKLQYKKSTASLYKDVNNDTGLYELEVIGGTQTNLGAANGEWGAAVKYDATHVIYVFQGSGNDAFVQVLEIDPSDGSITALGTALEFDLADQLGASICMIDSTHFIIFNAGSGSDGYVQTFNLNTSTWAITTWGTRLEFDTLNGTYPSCVQMDTNHFACAWRGDLNDGFVEIFEVNMSTGDVTEYTPLEYDISDSQFNKIIKIDSTHFVVLWAGVGADGFARAFSVNTGTWAITALDSNYEFDTQNGTHLTAYLADSNHIVVCNNGTAGDGFVRVLTVNLSTWAITTLGTPYEFDTDTYSFGSISPIVSANNEFIIFWTSTGDINVAQTFSVNLTTGAIAPTSEKVTIDSGAGQDYYNTSLYISDGVIFNAYYDSANENRAFLMSIADPPVVLADSSHIPGTMPTTGAPTDGNDVSSVAHTVVAGTKLLVIAVGNHQGTVTTVTWNGVTATKINGAATAFNETAELWVIGNPTPGTGNIVGTFSGGSGRMLVGINVFNCKTSNPTISATNTGSTATPTVNITPTTPGNLVIAAYYAEASFTGTGADQVAISTLLADSFEAFHVSKEEGVDPALTTMDATLSSGQRWAAVAIVIESDPVPSTAQLTAPSGKTTSDFDAGWIHDDWNPSLDIDISTDDYTEVEWAFKVKSPAVVGDTYNFRVIKESGLVLNTYSVTPDLTIVAGGSSGIKKFMGVTQANLKEVIGITNANVKKLAGVTN